jgi:hypothetical protein
MLSFPDSSASKAPLLPRIDINQARATISRSQVQRHLDPNEQKIMQTATSTEAFHSLGSAHIYGNIGKIMAEGMIKMEKK